LIKELSHSKEEDVTHVERDRMLGFHYIEEADTDEDDELLIFGIVNLLKDDSKIMKEFISQ
jgi:hypothetical protein